MPPNITRGHFNEINGTECNATEYLYKVDNRRRQPAQKSLCCGRDIELHQPLPDGTFLSDLKEGGKQEYLLPTIVDGLVKTGRANVRVLESRDKWVGVTYKEDKPVVVASIKELISSGKYPDKLYK